MPFHGQCWRCGEWGHREADCDADLDDLERKLQAARTEITQLEAASASQQKTIKDYKQHLAELERRVQEQQATIDELTELERRVEKQQATIDEQTRALDREERSRITFVEMALQRIMWEDRVVIQCRDGDVYAIKSVLQEASEFFAGLFSEISGASCIRASRPAPRDSETYDLAPTALLVALLHANGDAPLKTCIHGQGGATPEGATLDTLCDACELAAMWLLDDLLPTLAPYVRTHASLDEHGPSSLLAMRRLAQHHLQVDGWSDILLTVEGLLARLLINPRWMANTMTSLTLHEACELLSHAFASGPARYAAMHEYLSVHGYQPNTAGACETLANLRAIVAEQPCRHVAVRLAVRPGGVHCTLHLEALGPTLDTSTPPRPGPVLDALIVVADMAAQELWTHQGDVHCLDTACLVHVLSALEAPRPTQVELVPCASKASASTVPFKPTTNVESTLVGSEKVEVRFHCITMQPEYQHLSFEELRWAEGHVEKALPWVASERDVLELVLTWASHPRRALNVIERVLPYVRFPLLSSRVLLLREATLPGLSPLAQRSDVLKSLLAEAIEVQQQVQASGLIGTPLRELPLAPGLRPMHEEDGESMGDGSFPIPSRTRCRPCLDETVPGLSAAEMVKQLTT
jgi:hypothetical protein